MKKIYLFLIFPFLLATKCATKEIDFIIENESKDKYYITSTKNIDLINKYLSSKYIDEDRVINVDEKIVKPLFLEVSLNHYESKKGQYVFYTIKQNDYNNRNFEFDSICVEKNKFNVKNVNTIYINRKKYFKSTNH
ncbi:hypothetical protein ACFO3U_12955 [Flavobacterium ponti]|uniref:Lipoprotein n=1 Tax=Flavobacterium ponti TaxID=665133 RepID=A0ABV9P9B1_9FLAO